MSDALETAIADVLSVGDCGPWVITDFAPFFDEDRAQSIATVLNALSCGDLVPKAAISAARAEGRREGLLEAADNAEEAAELLRMAGLSSATDAIHALASVFRAAAEVSP